MIAAGPDGAVNLRFDQYHEYWIELIWLAAVLPMIVYGLIRNGMKIHRNPWPWPNYYRPKPALFMVISTLAVLLVVVGCSGTIIEPVDSAASNPVDSVAPSPIPDPAPESSNGRMAVDPAAAERYRQAKAAQAAPDYKTMCYDALEKIRVHFGEVGEPYFIPQDVNGDARVDLFDMIDIGQSGACEGELP